MKTLLTILISTVLLLALFSLSGCGDSSSDGGPDADGKPPLEEGEKREAPKGPDPSKQ